MLPGNGQESVAFWLLAPEFPGSTLSSLTWICYKRLQSLNFNR